MSTGIVAIILKGYPRLSETFIAQEIHELERRGFTLRLVSLRHPTDAKRHPVNDEIRAPVSYLPEYLYQAPLRVLRCLWRSRRQPGFRRALGVFLRDAARDPTPNRGRRFGQAAVLACELGDDVVHIHSHFLHTPSSVARYAAIMRALPWSFSAHAKDIWTIPDWEKKEKLADAAWGVTCTAYGREHLNTLASAGSVVELVYHGIDLARFSPATNAGSDRDGSNADNTVTIVSVGRLVAKKGYDDLIAALAALPRRLNWRLVHIGGGELGSELEAAAGAAGIGDRIEWRGSQSQQAVIEAMREGDVFALMSRIDESGDRDGLPNVLMEAQSQQLACLATRVAAIPELIVDGETGLLVEPRDRLAMTARLERLITDPALRRRLGAAGRARVHEVFSHEACIDALVRKFETAAGHPAIPAARAAE
jgi:glycosyltransferase involved in cell wall biosynthesis